MVPYQLTATGTRRRVFRTVIPVGAHGTFYYARQEGWRTLDFLIVTDSLRSQVASATVFTSLFGVSLLTTRKSIPKGSDHLPVMAEIHFQ